MPTELAAWFSTASEGNPLFLHALVNHWLETGTAGGVPPTLQVVIARRLDALTQDALLLLQAIVLLGPLATVPRALAVLAMPTFKALEALDLLSRTGALAEGSTRDVHVHELISSAALDRLSMRGRSVLHESIAEVLERESDEYGQRELLLPVALHLLEANNEPLITRFAIRRLPDLVQSGRPDVAMRVLRCATAMRPALVEEPAFARARVRLEHEIGEYERVLAGQPRLADLPPIDDAITDDAADAAIRVADSAYRVDPFVDRRRICLYTAEIVAQRQLSRGVRIRAADVSLVIAANLIDPTCAEFTLRGCDDLLSTDSLETRMVQLLYHTIFGSMDVASECADYLATRANGAHTPLERYRVLTRAAFALRITGDLTQAEGLFEQALRVGMELGSRHHQRYCYWQLSQIPLDRGDMSGALEWSAQLEALQGDSEDTVSRNFAISHLCRVAIELRDAERARELHQAYVRTGPRIPILKSAAYQTALGLGVELLDSEWCPTREYLDVAVARFIQTCAFGTSDFFASTLVAALDRAKLAADATGILEHYLARRRERGPLAACLQRTVSGRRASHAGFLATRPPESVDDERARRSV
jgi:hypothetical protein